MRWDSELYRAQSKAVLLRVLRSLKETGLPYSLDDVPSGTYRDSPRSSRAAASHLAAAGIA